MGRRRRRVPDRPLTPEQRRELENLAAQLRLEEDERLYWIEPFPVDGIDDESIGGAAECDLQPFNAEEFDDDLPF